MNTKPFTQIYLYTFSNPQISVSVKAPDFAEAIDELRLQFGFDWVRIHIDYFTIIKRKKLSKDA